MTTENTVKKACPFDLLFQEVKTTEESNEPDEPPEVTTPKKRGRPRKNHEELELIEEVEPFIIVGALRAKMVDEFKKKYHVNQQPLETILADLATKYRVPYCHVHTAMESEFRP